MGVESCCEAHDRNYGPDSTMTRWQADRELRRCIAQYRPNVSWIVWVGVRLFGWRFYKK